MRPPITSTMASRIGQRRGGTSLNATVVQNDYEWASYSASLRFMADVAGNADGIANESELALASIIYQSRPFRSFDVSIDGEPLPYRTTSVVSASGAGDPTSADPVRTVFRWDAWRRSPPLEWTSHDIRLEMFYPDQRRSISISQETDPFRARVLVGPDLAGNLTAVGRIWTGDPLPHPGNVTVRDLGGGSWDVIPGNSPYMLGTWSWFNAFLQVDIEASAAPPGPLAGPWRPR